MKNDEYCHLHKILAIIYIGGLCCGLTLIPKGTGWSKMRVFIMSSLVLISVLFRTLMNNKMMLTCFSDRGKLIIA